MKKKRVIWTYGNVILPLDVGERARYFQNGVLKVTGRVLRVLEQTEKYIKFETKELCYCISYNDVEEAEMVLAA